MADKPAPTKRRGLLDAMDELEEKRKTKRDKAKAGSRDLDLNDVWS